MHFLIPYLLSAVKKCQIISIGESIKKWGSGLIMRTILGSPMPSLEAISLGDSRQYYFNELIDFDVYPCFN
jgi:hypothetical protein